MNEAHQLLDRAMNVLELEGIDWLAKEIRAYLASEKQDQPEPVAWMYPDDIERFKTNETFAQAYSIKCGSPTQGTTEPLYFHPAPQRSFVRLSEEEIAILAKRYDVWTHVIRAIENALEEQNK